jgi:hypothetical protein
MHSLQSSGEGVTPIVLMLQPELSARGVAEYDEFARRGRLQNVAEKQFVRIIEVALGDAIEAILDRAAHAAMSGDAALNGGRQGKDKTVMAAGGPNLIPKGTTASTSCHLPRRGMMDRTISLCIPPPAATLGMVSQP